ncbi:hypothetical protein OBBRIDRAFT_356528 [Obba rivulosa]|uniref:F-box domain-containing protein n=1 Tax=Obba rivulosa TaxID=1052685 RepID=A0A8E2AMX9_9APHY|nr:hypothetical protein OBBRIDRAFT_356528 [Obba rivulosa]
MQAKVATSPSILLMLMLSSITILVVQGWLDWSTFTQRILSFASIVITYLLRPSIPPSPHLNFDILHYIMRELPTQDLCAAALVCREWACATQAPLYSNIFLDTSLSNAPLLSRTMTTCLHLRPLVRSLTVTIGIDTRDIALVDWLRLLPEDSVREFKIRQLIYEEDFATFILQSPFLRSVRRFECGGVFLRRGEHLENCFMLPQMSKSREVDSLSPKLFMNLSQTLAISKFEETSIVFSFCPQAATCLPRNQSSRITMQTRPLSF